LPRAKIAEFEDLLHSTTFPRSSILSWRFLRLGERTRFACGRRPPRGVRIFLSEMLIFMQHTEVVERLCVGKASFRLEGGTVKRGKGMLVASTFTLFTPHSAEGRLCETNPILGRPATRHPQGYGGTTPCGVTTKPAGAGKSRAGRPRYGDAWRRCYERRGTSNAVSGRDASRFTIDHAKRTQLGQGKAKGKCLLGMGLWRIRPGRGDEKTKPIAGPRPFPSRRTLASFCTIDCAGPCLFPARRAARGVDRTKRTQSGRESQA